MINILCYGDSNTWGCIPETFQRYEFDTRWPGVMQNTLGKEYHIYENALNGRTTVFEDFIEEGRNGKDGLPITLEINGPLDLVIFMLGTNDMKNRFNMSSWDVAWGMDLLVQYVKKANCGRDGKCPKILICSPIELGTKWDQTILGTVFDDVSTQKSLELAAKYKEVAKRNDCEFFETAKVAKASIDCVHMEPEDHKDIGIELAKKVKEIL
jgi:lysophospholipase L1-like esterase